MKYRFAMVAVSAFLLSLQAEAQDAAKDSAPAASATAGDPVVLKVDGDDIHQSEIDQAWKTIFQGREVPPLATVDEKVRERFLREVASERVLYKEGVKEGIENQPDTKALLDKLQHQVVIQELLKEKAEKTVTDDKLKAAYDAHLKASKDADVEEFKARHILVKDKAEADAVEKKLKGGADFAKLAKDESQDKASGAAGGELGWFTADKMLPEFSNATMKLKKGQISSPVKTDFGWHVIQLEDRRKATPPSFDEVKDSLKQEVGAQAMEAYVNSLMSGVKVTEVTADGKEKAIPPETLSPAAGGNGSKSDSAE